MQKKVSVIIPVYNAEKDIERCIQSVTKQTLQDIEIIIVDDGSEDSSVKICEEYAKQDTRIKIITQENKGVSIARNIGIRNSEGEYIAFLDADDWIEQDMYKVMWEQAHNMQVDICTCSYYIHHNKQIHKHAIGIEFPLLNESEIVKYIVKPIIQVSNEKNTYRLLNVWSSLYKREILYKNNIKFDEYTKIGEDLLFNLVFMLHIDRAYILKQQLYHYSINQKSATNKYIKSYWENNKRLIQSIEELITVYQLNIDSSIFTIHSIISTLVNACKGEKKYIESIGEIKELCKDERVIEVVSKCQGMNVQWSKKLYIYLLKYKMYTGIYLYSKGILLIKKYM